MKFPFDKSALGNVSVALMLVALVAFGYGVYCGIHLGSVSAAEPLFVRQVIWGAVHILLALTLPVMTVYGAVNKSERALDMLRNCLVALICVYVLDFFIRVALYTNCTATTSNAYVDCTLSVVVGLDLPQSITTAVVAVLWVALSVVTSIMVRRSYTMTLRDAFDAERQGATDPVVSDKVPLMGKATKKDKARERPDDAAAVPEPVAPEKKKTKKKKKEKKKGGK